MPPKAIPARLTHFLCLPLVTPHSRPQLQASLQKFRADVTDPEDADAFPETAIRPLGTLHLTLSVMSLLSQERVDQALGVLRGLDLGALLARSRNETRKEGREGMEVTRGDGSVDSEDSGLKITLRGLASMSVHTGGSAAKSSILYSPPVDEDQTLQRFCQELKNAFVDAELDAAATRPLLLHATIVNTVYVPEVKGRGKARRERLTLDTREVLEKYEGFEWMRDVRVEEVAILRMGARRGEDGDEVYEVEGSVDMP